MFPAPWGGSKGQRKRGNLNQKRKNYLDKIRSDPSNEEVTARLARLIVQLQLIMKLQKIIRRAKSDFVAF